MALYTKASFSSLCRLCISFSQSNQDIFGDDSNTTEILCKLYSCLSFKIEPDDPLPKSLCKSCIEKLDSYNEFRLSCESSESMLQCYYSFYKTNIDCDGTIFVKSNDAVGSVNESQSDVVGVTSIGGGDGACSDEVLDTTTQTSPSSRLVATTLIEPNLDSPSHHINSEAQAHTPILSDINVNNISDIAEALSLANNTNNIVLLDLNKCGLLEYLDPSSAVYVLNGNSRYFDGGKGEVVAEQGEDVRFDTEVGTQAETILTGDVLLSGGVTCQDTEEVTGSDINLDDPILSQQGIDNADKFLNNIYSSHTFKNDGGSMGRGTSDTVTKTNSSRLRSDVYIDSSSSSNDDMSKDKLCLDNNRDNLNESSSCSDLATPQERDSQQFALDTDDVAHVIQPELTNTASQILMTTDSNMSATINIKLPLTQDNSNLLKQQESTVIKTEPTDESNVHDSTQPQVLSHVENTLEQNKICQNENLSNPTSKKAKRTRSKKSPGEGTLFECPLCMLKFSDSTLYSHHQLIHENNYLELKSRLSEFECLLCHKKFDTMPNLTRHMKIHDGIKEYQCQHCDKSYGRRWHLRRHTETVHPVAKAWSPGSTSGSGSPPSGDQPAILRYQEYACNICSRKYKRKDNLKAHMSSQHSKQYTCDTCSSQFLSSSSFQKHKATECFPRKCTTCATEFDSKTFYLQHINSDCGKNQVVGNISLVKRSSTPRLRCAYCPSTFTLVWKHKLHVEQHKKQRDVPKPVTRIPTTFTIKSKLYRETKLRDCLPDKGEQSHYTFHENIDDNSANTESYFPLARLRKNREHANGTNTTERSNVTDSCVPIVGIKTEVESSLSGVSMDTYQHVVAQRAPSPLVCLSLGEETVAELARTEIINFSSENLPRESELPESADGMLCSMANFPLRTSDNLSHVVSTGDNSPVPPSDYTQHSHNLTELLEDLDLTMPLDPEPVSAEELAKSTRESDLLPDSADLLAETMILLPDLASNQKGHFEPKVKDAFDRDAAGAPPEEFANCLVPDKEVMASKQSRLILPQTTEEDVKSIFNSELQNHGEKNNSKDSGKGPPVRTIRILLERFDPDKIAQYSAPPVKGKTDDTGKNSLKRAGPSQLHTQPYNLRKPKEVQTYICAMDD